MLETPAFWKTDLDTIEQLALTAKAAEVRKIGISAGGRPMWCFSYGEKQPITHQANYSSACGGHDKSCYVPLEGKKPVVLLLGAVHGGETEGTAAAINLISLLETGKDLIGNEYPSLIEAARKVRLVIVPVCNPDGRARVQPAAMIGCTGDELRYWMQGTWTDGSLCGWPDCKKTHPIKEKVDFLGGYFNDDGINLMHDNFFHPMAAETQALIDLCDEESADWILHLHGGSNSTNVLLQTRYVTLECQEAIHNLAMRCDETARATTDDLRFNIQDIPGKECGKTPPSFNLTSALHHVCGGVSAVFESNQCIIDQSGTHYNHEQVYRSHRILFEQCFLTACGE
ncbi:MAG: hypothetical protein IJE08_07940 [Clostridia bacterium]|nr:hypothetical protein [Clostridia bacterium]